MCYVVAQLLFFVTPLRPLGPRSASTLSTHKLDIDGAIYLDLRFVLFIQIVKMLFFFSDLPDQIPKSIVKILLASKDDALATVKILLAINDDALATKDELLASKYENYRHELEKVRSIVEALQLRVIVEEVAAKIRLQVGQPLSVQDALKHAQKHPEFIACMGQFSLRTRGTKPSPSDIQNTMLALCNILSKPAHEYLEAFDMAHPTFTRHEAVRLYLPTIRCLAKMYDVRVSELC
jgi:hypothetical protein